MDRPESISTGPSGEYSLDEDDQLQPEDTLLDRGVADVLDEGYSPRDRPPPGMGADTAAVYESDGGETLDQLLAEEDPDPAMAVNEPLDEAEQWSSDAAERDTEFPPDEEVGTERSGRLLAPDEGLNEDEESELLARDVGIDAGAASAEEAAVHLIDDE